MPVERVLHAPAVHFKGKGFYNTDYGTRKRQRETAAAAEKPSETSAKDGGESGSSDGKADAGKGEQGAKASTPAKDVKPLAAKG